MISLTCGCHINNCGELASFCGQAGALRMGLLKAAERQLIAKRQSPRPIDRLPLVDATNEACALYQDHLLGPVGEAP